LRRPPGWCTIRSAAVPLSSPPPISRRRCGSAAFRAASRRPPERNSRPLVPLASLAPSFSTSGFFAFKRRSQARPYRLGGDGQVVASGHGVNTCLSGQQRAIAPCCWTAARSTTWSLLATINEGLAAHCTLMRGRPGHPCRLARHGRHMPLAANSMHPWGAVATGAIPPPSTCASAQLVISVGIDDPLEAVGVHFGGGLAGLLVDWHGSDLAAWSVPRLWWPGPAAWPCCCLAGSGLSAARACPRRWRSKGWTCRSTLSRPTRWWPTARLGDTVPDLSPSGQWKAYMLAAAAKTTQLSGSCSSRHAASCLPIALSESASSIRASSPLQRASPQVQQAVSGARPARAAAQPAAPCKQATKHPPVAAARQLGASICGGSREFQLDLRPAWNVDGHSGDLEPGS
uniref:Ammonium_transp domain-containing protein n=1 Tax=Macrostomum lignano TaxID=282301 RepID=A0A1I8FA62_9PLAT